MLKIKEISIAGFRGFNNEKSLDINNKLTIIYGPNSYGKTSISEALEWLLFGVTSKVQECVTGKTEFKGTYRNIHYKGENKPFVELILQEDFEEISLRGELNDDDTIDRYFNNKLVDDWPWYKPGLEIYSPFILQHALQDFLLSSPSTRYSKISKIMGTQVLEEFQKIFNSLATSFNPPVEVQRFIDETNSFVNNLDDKEFANLVKTIRKKDLTKTIDEINELVSHFFEVENISIIDSDDQVNHEILDDLIEIRNREVSAIFDKEIILYPISDQENEYQSSIIEKIALIDTQEVIDQYLDYAKLKTRQDFVKLARFFADGLEIINTQPQKCPFCGTDFSEDTKEHIETKHKKINEKISLYEDLNEKKRSFIAKIESFKNDVEKYYLTLHKKTKTLIVLDNENDKAQLKKIFGEEELTSYEKLFEIITLFQKSLASFEEKKQEVDKSLNQISESFSQFNQSIDQIKNLRESLTFFLSSGNNISELINSCQTDISEISRILDNKLNLLAGTQNLAKFIFLITKYSDLKKYMHIMSSVDSIKDLRSSVTEFVNEKTISLIEGQLTEEVMGWYEQIKTEGDPDVHFSGFH